VNGKNYPAIPQLSGWPESLAFLTSTVMHFFAVESEVEPQASIL